MQTINLHTDGGAFYTKGTTDEYVGYYNLTNGKYYSGRSLTADSTELERIPLNAVQYVNSSGADRPDVLKTFTPSPTDEDYKRGWFVRYFARRTNIRESRYYEISQDEYDTITGGSKPLYIAVQLRWKITGPRVDVVDGNTILEPGVFNTNDRSIKLLGIEHAWLRFRLQNKLEFYRDAQPPYFGPPLQTSGNQLSTAGS